MDATRRLRYLDALGVDVWQHRNRSTTEDEGASPPAVAETEPDTAPDASADAVAGLGWPDLEQAVAECRRCGLCEGRNRTVFGCGDRAAEWMVVGEAPGAEEDRQGEPFVGAAGQLLTAMLRAAGFGREQVFIANTLKCRPPRNRDPQVAELAACRPYLERQIALVKPRLLLVVGRVAAQALLGVDSPMARLRGRVQRLPGSDVPLVATYHPAYLLRSPGEKRRAWQDLLLARSVTADADGDTR
jgi:DNA polymerase